MIGEPTDLRDPMRIVAHLRGPLTAPPMLDGLLAFVEAQRAGLVAGFGPIEPVEIPIAREPGGRFHLVTSPIAGFDGHELRYVNRKFPVAEAQMLGDVKLRRVNVSAGPCKSYRLPQEVRYAVGDAIEWYGLGDIERVRDLLSEVTHIGKKRAVGRGAVDHWSVEPCEPWGDGFPVTRKGLAMRPLPLDWPGLVEPCPAYHTLTFPYFAHEREELVAVP